MANTLAVQLWGTPDHYSMEYVDYAIPDRYAPIPFSPAHAESADNALELDALEQHYANENQLIEAVSKGRLHQVTAVAATALCMRWPKYWSFSLSIIPFKEIPGLISFRMDWLDGGKY